jgi:RNA-directed DNA polymerase
MTASVPDAGASPGVEHGWKGIDWPQCYHNVRRLQARIVKATKQGRWGKVKALQWLLTHSHSGKALAVRRVTENQGKKTPGVDMVTWPTPDDKARAIEALQRRGYQPKPLRRLYIPKANGKKRALGIPTMKDRAMQALHLLALEPISETCADTHSYGFRPERSTADALEHSYLLFAHLNAPQWILEGDIRGCFDEISHDWLIANVPTDVVVLRKWLKAGYREGGQLFPTEAGTPQGGIISPTLANWALDGLQEHLALSCGRRFTRDRRRISPAVNLVRYADDFIITGFSKEWLEDEVKPRVQAFLAERGLELSPSKTRITKITDGFDFLGQNIRQYKNRVQCKPAKANIKKFLDKVRLLIKRLAAVSQQALIAQLNPLIVGWANYHKHCAASKVMNRVDHEIWRALWRWCRRRHRGKSRRWIKRRYFHTVGFRSWVFMADTGQKTESGKRKWLALRKASDIKYRRYTKIRAEANPFDPEWESYFEDRIGLKMLDHLDERKKLIRLWLDQRGICPICEQRITKDTGWHAHHIVRKVDGGKNNEGNLMLLHPTCHTQVHSRGLTVSKPAPTRGLERLEPDAVKVASPVLRGGSGGNATSSPDIKTAARKSKAGLEALV